jgi:outer membrane immunogenic protein
MGLLMALTAVQAAVAADLVSKAPYEAPSWSWTGFYIGATAGYGWEQLVSPPSPGQFGPPTPTGGLWGGQVGANYQFASRWVVGVEFDGAVARLENSMIGPDPLVPTTLLAVTAKLNNLMLARGRFGFAWDDTLFYVSGGAAWAQSQILSSSSLGGGGGPQIVTDQQTIHGSVFGGGVEKQLWRNFTGRVEYLYVRSDPFSVNGQGGVVTGVRSNIQTMMVGVNWLFH